MSDHLDVVRQLAVSHRCKVWVWMDADFKYHLTFTEGSPKGWRLIRVVAP